jgi:release factor glutamine methyltransferase
MMPTIRQALTDAKLQITSDTPSLDAQVLLEYVLNIERVYLFAHDDDTLTDEQHDKFQEVVKRRVDGEPIPYIMGTKGFYDLEFAVTPAVLIPRPETELLLEDALRLMQDKPNCQVADIGTGSGALAVTFAKHSPQSHVYATDVSEPALAVATSNAHKNQADVQFMLGNLAQPLIDNNIKVACLMANLPYIPYDEMLMLAVSKHEPTLALDGGQDGLDLIRDLLKQVPEVCESGAFVLLEIGADQGDALKLLVQNILEVSCDILQDYAGLDRIGRFQV